MDKKHLKPRWWLAAIFEGSRKQYNRFTVAFTFQTNKKIEWNLLTFSIRPSSSTRLTLLVLTSEPVIRLWQTYFPWVGEVNFVRVILQEIYSGNLNQDSKIALISPYLWIRWTDFAHLRTYLAFLNKNQGREVPSSLVLFYWSYPAYRHTDGRIFLYIHMSGWSRKVFSYSGTRIRRYKRTCEGVTSVYFVRV